MPRNNRKKIQKLNKLGKAFTKNVEGAMRNSANEIVNEAKISISNISQGKAYKRRGKVHIASKPGDAPNTDQGQIS